MSDNTQQQQSQPKQEQTHHDEHAGFKRREPMHGGIAVLVIVIGLAVAVLLAVLGIVPRLRATKQLETNTNATAAPDVMVDKAGMGKPDETVVLPGALQAYIDSPVYARTNGYLKKWYFDIGAHVHAGQLLAVIESPEIDQELAQAQANLATAEATAKNAAVQGKRYSDLVQQNAVSQLDTDNFVTQQVSSNTQVQSAKASVQQFEQLVGFEKVYAPFDGVITARSIDQGQLINAGANGAQILFQEAQTQRLRVYVSVPQIDSLGCKPGVPATVTLAEYPERTFAGKIVRTAQSIDPGTRTLLVEVDVDNRKGELMPGAYGEVHLTLNTGVQSLLVPVPALIFRAQGMQVAVIENGKAHLKSIRVGQNDGRVVQVVSGISPDDEIVQFPPDSIIDGEAVHVVQPQAGAAPASPSSSGGSNKNTGGGA